MPVKIPFVPSKNNYRLVVPLSNVPYIFDVRWNDEDHAWYFDLRDEDEELIIADVKVLLGVRIGRSSSHLFFATRTISVRDTTSSGDDPGFDDLGNRVEVIVTDLTEVIA